MSNQVYIVCTRSAVSASTLVYMINQSPDFYGVCHNDLWLKEYSNEFGMAATINDWWNIPDEFTEYNKTIRNADILTVDQVTNISAQWQSLNTGRNIAVFSHATNAYDIQQATQHLPVTIVSTHAGDDFTKYVNLWIKREYNTIMNDYESFEIALYNVLDIIFDRHAWQRADMDLYVDNWLGDVTIYSKLGIAPASIELWKRQYLLKNDYYSELPLDHTVSRIKSILDATLANVTTDPATRYFEAKKLLYAVLQSTRGFNSSGNWQDIINIAKKDIGLY